MRKKLKKLKPFLQKMRFKYRVSILNENTLEESWHVRLSRFSVLLYGSILIFLTFSLLTVLIFSTNISRYLPGYGDSGNRSKILQESTRADSLLHQMELQQGYLIILKDIITGKIKADSISPIDTSKLKKEALSKLEQAKREKAFVEKFEKQEKYNLSIIESSPSENAIVFFRPTNGVISSSFSMEDGQMGIYIATSPNEPVISVLSGTVIYAEYTFSYNWVIEVQHDNNYISIYKNNTRLLKKIGDKVRGGESIAITGSANHKNIENQFYFELWKKGMPINPEDVIIF